MKTSELIKDKARELFNSKGMMNVTLREIATVLNKSYGNITYHFSTKEALLESLFVDYNEALLALQKDDFLYENHLHYLLILPEFSFDVTVKYLFFYIDYTEIKRAYPKFITKVELKNKERKKMWKELMLTLQKQQFFQRDLTTDDLDYIMELSAGYRMFYFQEKMGKELNKADFSIKVNRLLRPYLSSTGIAFYLKFKLEK